MKIHEIDTKHMLWIFKNFELMFTVYAGTNRTNMKKMEVTIIGFRIASNSALNQRHHDQCSLPGINREIK